MATVRTLAGDGEIVVNTERSLISSLANSVRVVLPAIDAGAGATVAADFTITVEARSTGDIEVVDNKLRFVTRVSAGSATQLQAVGNLAFNRWVVIPVHKTVASVGGQESTGAGSATIGAANCPATTVGSVYKWVKTVLSDGTVGYVPVWK
jgi:hypothetical protein